MSQASSGGSLPSIPTSGPRFCSAGRGVLASPHFSPVDHLPEEFATLRRLIEARMAKRGKREFVQVLRLLEVFRLEDVLAGVREAIARGVIGFDAVKHLVLCRIERRPPRLDLTVYPYLPHATVAITSAGRDRAASRGQTRRAPRRGRRVGRRERRRGGAGSAYLGSGASRK